MTPNIPDINLDTFLAQERDDLFFEELNKQIKKHYGKAAWKRTLQKEMDILDRLAEQAADVNDI